MRNKSSRDLLSRHQKLSHPSIHHVSSSSTSAEEAAIERPIWNDPEFLWDPEFLMQDLLPATLFDSTLPSPSVQPTPSNHFPLFASRLPRTNELEDHIEAEEEAKGVEGITDKIVTPWSVSGTAYERFCRQVDGYGELLPAGYTLPSRNTLARNLEGYFRCLQEQLPFIHSASFHFDSKDVELIMAVAALGALYRFEYSSAYSLYSFAKAILFEKIHQENLQLSSDLMSENDATYADHSVTVERLQTFVLLITFSSWTEKSLLPDALSMSSQLASLIKQNDLWKSEEVLRGFDWAAWTAIEERRRTLLAAYVIFNMHTIAFDTPPLILGQEIAICLPSYAEQWKATTSKQWQRSPRHIELTFQAALQPLLDGTACPSDAHLSSFSNYILIHGLLQEIIASRHQTDGSLSPKTVKSHENALRSWQLFWERTHESTLDPLSAKGPLGINATALLRLAYIRLNSMSGLGQRLSSHDLLTSSTFKPTSLDRSPSTDRAVLHAAHALSIPVRLGLELIARVKLPFQSIENSLCSVECALLLQDWLESVSTAVSEAGGVDSLRKTEKSLLRILCGIIQETVFAELPNAFEDEASQIRRMATKVAQLWAKVFQGSHVLEIDNVISIGLQSLAEVPSPV